MQHSATEWFFLLRGRCVLASKLLIAQKIQDFRWRTWSGHLTPSPALPATSEQRKISVALGLFASTAPCGAACIVGGGDFAAMQENPPSSDSSRLGQRVWSTSGIPFANILRQKACIVTVQGGKGRSPLGGLTFSDPECVLVYNLATTTRVCEKMTEMKQTTRKGRSRGRRGETRMGRPKLRFAPPIPTASLKLPRQRPDSVRTTYFSH